MRPNTRPELSPEGLRVAEMLLGVALVALTVKSVPQPPNATAVLNANGTVTYTPTAGHLGADSITYIAYDGRANRTSPQRPFKS